METPLKQRLIGAAVLAALAIIFLPMLLKGPDVKEPDAAEVPLSMPAAPGDAFETRELPLTAPEAPAGADGVLGMKPAAPTATDATGTDEIVPEDAVADAVPPAVASAAATPTASAPANAAPATVAAPAKPELPATGGPEVAAGAHALTVGTFSNASSAAALAARLRAAGLPVQSDRVTLASGPATRIRVGPFASRAAAEGARLRVEQISGAPAKAVVLDAAAPGPAIPAPAPAPSKASAPATTSAAPKPAAPPVSSGFAVQLSAPASETDANALRDRARGAGFASFVQRVDTPTGVRYRVRLGPVADRRAAEAMQADARAKLGMAGLVVANP